MTLRMGKTTVVTVCGGLWDDDVLTKKTGGNALTAMTGTMSLALDCLAFKIN